jgi:thioredoxin reductase (NADPH)
MGSMTDIIVVGAGPAGYSAAINAVTRGKTVRLLSSSSSYLEKAERVDNYLGFHQIDGEAMMKVFADHALAMGVTAETGKVSNIFAMKNQFLVNFSGDILEARAVVMATGVAKTKAVRGEQELLGKGVSYCATCDGMLYRGRKAVVWGQADDAAEEANYLKEIGVQITFISPKERPSELHLDISFIQGALVEIQGKEKVSGVLYKAAGGSGQDAVLETEAVFVLQNSIAPTTLVDGLAVENGYVAVDRRMATNIPGLYAAGDCTGLPLQIAKAVGEGLVAAQSAAKYIDELKSQSGKEER